jgi:hypothetical protein
MYQGERGTGARPNGRARKAMSTSDANSGSKVTTVRPQGVYLGWGRICLKSVLRAAPATQPGLPISIGQGAPSMTSIRRLMQWS